MSEYIVTYEWQGRLPDRDAFHLTVRVSRDGDDLGQFQTWVSGVALATVAQLNVTSRQFWRLLAEHLGGAIEHAVRAGELRDLYDMKVDVLPVDLSEVFAAAKHATRVIPDLHDGDVVGTFRV